MERRGANYRLTQRQSKVALVARRTLAAVAALLLLLASMTTSVRAAAPAASGTCSVAFTPGSASTAKASAASAHISLNTASAASGSQIVVRGTGWPAKAQVVIGIAHFVQTDGAVNAFDGVSHATVTSAGTFTAQSFTFPVGVCGALPRAGTVAEIVAHTPDQQMRVTAPLSIVQTPTIRVPLTSANLLPAISAIPVNGSDWMPGSAVSLVAATVRLGCEPASSIEAVRCLTALPGARAIVAHAGADGRFSVNVPLPSAVVPGTSVQVFATISARPYGKLVLQSEWYGVIPPGIAPTLTLDRQTAPAGTTVAISGDHWPSGKPVIVEYCRSDAVSQGPAGPECNQSAQGLVTTGYAQELGEGTVDAAGHLSARVTLPANARPGPVMFQARVEIVAPADSTYFIYVQTASFIVTKTGPPQAAQAMTPWWPFAAAGGGLVLLIGLVLWRRGAFRVRPDR